MLRLNLRGRHNGPGTFRRRASLFSSAAFSLIELLVCLALMLIMFTMLWGFSSPSHQAREKQHCEENLQKIFLALEIYANDNQADFPVVSNAEKSEQPLDLLVPKYTVDTSIFICPGSKDSPIPNGDSIRNRRISYAYYMGRSSKDTNGVLMSDQQINTASKAAGDPVFSDTGKPPGNNHHKFGGNFLFCDGHVEANPSRAAFSLVITQSVVLLNP